MKKLAALVIALLLVGVSFTPAFAGERRHRDRDNHNSRDGHHQLHGVSPGLGIGLGILGLGILYGARPHRYREVIIETQRECGYIPVYVWNPNWQRWESSLVFHCQQVGR